MSSTTSEKTGSIKSSSVKKLSKTNSLNIEIPLREGVKISGKDNNDDKEITKFRGIARESAKQLIDAAKRGKLHDLSDAIKSAERYFSVNRPVTKISGMSALHIAARHGNWKCVQLLIQRGGRIDTRCDARLFSMTPLMLAVYFCEETPSRTAEYCKTIDVLVNAGKGKHEDSINNVDGLQRTAIHWAAIKGYRSAIGQLRLHGPNLNSKDHYESTPLHYAIDMALLLGDSYGIETELLKKVGDFDGTDPNAANDFQETALHIICDQGIGDNRPSTLQKYQPKYHGNVAGRANVVKVLLEYKADATCRNRFGRTAADQAAHPELLTLLKEKIEPEELTKRLAKTKMISKQAASEFREYVQVERTRATEQKRKYVYLEDVPQGLLESARKYYALMKNPFTTSDLVEQIEKEFTGKATFGFSDELTERETHEQIKITYGRVLAKLEDIEKISANFTKTEWIGNL